MLSTIERPHPDAGARSATSSQPSVESQATALFEGLLLQTALAPVAKAMGFYGDIVVAEAARRIAQGIP